MDLMAMNFDTFSDRFKVGILVQTPPIEGSQVSELNEIHRTLSGVIRTTFTIRNESNALNLSLISKE
jgi:hypothetical protein